jgi:hypothetical protein
MKKISFTDVVLGEDAAVEISAMQAQIAMLQTRKARADKVIDDQLRRLQQNLAIKMKQNSIAQASAQNTQPGVTPPAV